ncbi:MAG TPA: hypothetical protein VHS09_15095 [Polyangiaceae bacterium]|nr:hypothetical protein [Polyangiaceae bacterium]
MSWPIVFAGLSAPFIVNCGSLPKMPGGLPGIPSCPDMSKPDEIAKFDFAGSFKLKPDVAAKVKAGVGAAVEMKILADKIDADLTAACGKIATDLGDTNTYKNAQDACKAAAAIIGSTKAKLGAAAKVTLDVDPPKCGLDINAYGDCGASCDATVKPGGADIQCDGGKLQGTCGASCSGECDMTAAAACSGECDGTCDADVSGSCSGNCNGKCDGKASSGACAGKCDGKCSGNVKATCKGKCGGTCKMTAAASCKGTCTGTCSAKMDAPKCTGTVKPPAMSADCKAKCDAQVQANASCTPPHVLVHIIGAADAAAATKLQTVLESDLPLVLNVAIGTAKNVGQIVAGVKTVVEGVEGVVKTATSDKIAGAALIACVASPFKGAIDAATGIQANVSVSVSVQGSVSGGSASGSASASGKAGG